MERPVINSTFAYLKPPHNIPPSNAESLMLSNYTMQLQKQSKWIPNLQVPDIEVMRCPSCKMVNKVVEHQRAVVCNCGLRMRSSGNELLVWKEEKSW